LIKRLFILITFIYGLTAIAWAQVTIKGKVTDANTGEPLPAVNILIRGTYTGTITNVQGDYSLTVDKMPAEVEFRYIGYRTHILQVDERTSARQDIRLQPVTLKMSEIVVTGEDPALDIMRKVIKNKERWRKKLNTYKADAYTRQVLANDTGIVSINESISKAFWDKEKGHREVIISKRQTANVKQSQNFAATSYVPNFYDDNIDIAGYTMVGPTNPKALDYYNFKLEGYEYQDDKLIYDISMTPNRKLQPTFKGTLKVMDKVYALVAVNLKPGKSVFFPPPVKSVDLHYKQQFYNFGKDFWLPVDMRVDGSVKIAMIGLDFPKIKFHQVSRLTDYRVNVPLPDSLYNKKKVLYVDSLTVNNKELFNQQKQVVPLSSKESTAYQTIDSTDSFARAFKPKGFLARYVEMNDNNGNSTSDKSKNSEFDKLSQGITPELWYNRVDGGHLGLSMERDIGKRMKYRLNGGYDTYTNRISYGVGGTYQWGNKKNGFVNLDYKTGTATRYKSDLYDLTENSVLPLLGRYDYFDYLWNDGFTGEIGYRFKKINSTFKVGFNDYHQTSLAGVTNYDLLGRDYQQRINPPIDDGWLRSLSFTFDYGDKFIPFSPIGQQHITLHVEHSIPDVINSDYDFTTYQLSVDWRFKTFFTRRFLSNVLDLRLVGGTYSGKLPLQKFGILDASMGGYTPFGSFKTQRSNPFEGESYLGLYWEHNFRTIPFEWLGLQSLAEKGYSIIVFGADGRTWINKDRLKTLQTIYNPKYKDGFHHEIGISLNGIFGLFRLDFAKRVGESGYTFGVSVARIL
jgi:hypothetical protein